MDATYHKTKLSVTMTNRSIGLKHEQLQHGEQPYTAAGYGRSFSHKAILKGHGFYILSAVRNPVICVKCSELSLRHLQCRLHVVFLYLVFFNKCHGVICKMCGCFVNRCRAGGSRDPGLFTPWHRSSSIPLALSLFVYVA